MLNAQCSMPMPNEMSNGMPNEWPNTQLVRRSLSGTGGLEHWALALGIKH